MNLKNVDIQTLLSKIKSEKLKMICIGAGDNLKEACNLFCNFDFFDNIYAIADNYLKDFKWNGITKQTLTPAEIFSKINPQEVVVYITPLSYPEIYEQLEQMTQLKDVECYIHIFVIHIPIPYNFDSECRKSEKRLIPKKIHYCWFGGKEIPEQNKVWMESWPKYCPDYEIIKWNEDNYDITKNEYMYSAYKENKYAHVSDYARLDIVCEHGGIYLDSDVELLKNIDTLLYNKCFIGTSVLGVLNTGLGFGAVSDFPLISAFRDYYDDFPGDCDNWFIENCCYHQTKVMSNYSDFATVNKPQYIGEAAILPTDVLSPIDWRGNPSAFNTNTHAIHHYAASWLNPEEIEERCSDLQKYRNFWNKYFKELK